MAALGRRSDDVRPEEQDKASARTALITQAEELVRQHMAQYDPSHDWAHVDRVRKTALKLAGTLKTPLDMLVVELVALFHDMAAKYTETASLPAVLRPFFSSPATQRTLSAGQQADILKIIPCISWTAEKKLRAAGAWSEWHDTCSELHVVQDADRLDAIGAVGVLRCAAFSGAKGRILVDEGTGASAEGHFEEKLLLIKDRMKTAAGREEASRRHETMVHFLEALRFEKGFMAS